MDIFSIKNNSRELSQKDIEIPSIYISGIYLAIHRSNMTIKSRK